MKKRKSNQKKLNFRIDIHIQIQSFLKRHRSVIFPLNVTIPKQRGL